MVDSDDMKILGLIVVYVVIWAFGIVAGVAVLTSLVKFFWMHPWF